MLSAVREFKKRKQEVLTLFDQYAELASEGRVEPVPPPLAERVRELREDRFIIAVCGEVKAGKSTFINALIGEEALPTHRLQKSSVLIDVCAAPHRSIVVEYGDGREEVVFDEEDPANGTRADSKTAYEHLEALASLQDRYRALPTTFIEDYILSRDPNLSGSISKEVAALMKTTPNYVAPPDEHELIEEFLAERGSPDLIPVHITLSLPLPYAELSELRIVDTPGVNALGGVQDRTYQFIESAHATLFVHDITKTASEPFRRFIERGLSERGLKSTLLVLTHAGHLYQEEKQSFLSQMYRDFPEFRDRMIPVDSELRIIEHQMDDGRSIEEVEEVARAKSDFVKKRLLGTVREAAAEEGVEAIEVVHQRANFEALEEAVRRFASTAPLAALSDILTSLTANLETASSSLDSEAKLLKKKLRSPQAFEQELDSVRKELQRYQRELGDFTEALEGRYMGQDSSWRREFEEIRNTFNADLGKKSLSSVDEVRKLFTDTNDSIEQTLNTVLREVRQECERKLDELGGAFTNATEHRLPKIDFASLEREAKKKAEVPRPRYTYHEGFSLAFWKWVRPFHVQKKKLAGYDTVIDEEKKIQTLKGTLLESFSDGFGEITRDGGTVEATVRSYLRSVTGEGKRLVEHREREMDAIKERQESNAEMAARLEHLSDQRAHFDAILNEVRTAKVNL